MLKYLFLIFCALSSLRLCPGQQIFSLFDYEDYYGSPLLNAQPSNSLIIESKNPSPPIIPLREVKIQNSGLSLFDNEPVSINTVRTTPTVRTNNNKDLKTSFRSKSDFSTISNTNSIIPIERKNDGGIGNNGNGNYGQFSSFQESKKGEADTYRLHGQNEEGKNTQIIINLTNEPKSYLGGYEKEQTSKEDLFSTDYPVYDDFIGPPAPPPSSTTTTTIQPPPAPTVGPPAPPTTVGPPAPPPSPPVTQLPQYRYRTTAAPIYYGQVNPQAEPPFAPPQNYAAAAPPLPQAPPVQNYAAVPQAAPPPQNYQVAQAPPPTAQQAPPPQQNYGVAPQAPPQQSYGVPQAPPPQQSYGVPQAPPQQSYGVPQAPPVSYDPPAPPPPADPVVQLQTQYVMPALTLKWEQPVIQQEIVPQDPIQEPPPLKPSYNAPNNNFANDDNGLTQTRFDPETGNSYHIHVSDINDIRQLDEIFGDVQSNQNQPIPPQRPQRPERPQRPQRPGTSRNPFFRLRNPLRRPNRRPNRNNYNYNQKRNPIRIRNPIVQEANGLSEWLNIKCLFFCALSHADYDTSESF